MLVEASHTYPVSHTERQEGTKPVERVCGQKKLRGSDKPCPLPCGHSQGQRKLTGRDKPRPSDGRVFTGSEKADR